MFSTDLALLMSAFVAVSAVSLSHKVTSLGVGNR